MVLSDQEFAFPALFNSLLAGLRPLMAVKHADRNADQLMQHGAEHEEDDWDRAVQVGEMGGSMDRWVDGLMDGCMATFRDLKQEHAPFRNLPMTHMI